MNRVINTTAELDALPVRSVVVEGDHTTPDPVGSGQFATIPGVFHRFPDGWYVVAGHGKREVPPPALVLHDPSAPVLVVSDAAVPSATREHEVDGLADVIWETSRLAAFESEGLARALLARFTITPRTDR